MLKWFETGWFRVGIRIDAINLRKYSKALHTALEQERKRFESRVEKEARKFEPRDRDEYYSLISTEHWQLNEVIPNLLYKSILTASYSFLEHSLIWLAKHIGSNRGISLQTDICKNEGIEWAHCYIKKVLGIPFPTGKDWNEIQHLRKIRNRITHAEGTIPDDKKYDAIRSYIQKTNGLSIGQFDSIKVEESYCQYAISLSERFIIEVVEICEQSGNKVD